MIQCIFCLTGTTWMRDAVLPALPAIGTLVMNGMFVVESIAFNDVSGESPHSGEHWEIEIRLGMRGGGMPSAEMLTHLGFVDPAPPRSSND